MIDKKRGISPVIAVLLLTALAIAMSLAIVTVFQGFVKEKCKLSNQACELLCDKINPFITKKYHWRLLANNW